MSELHWKKYPYPEENVYLIIGGRVDGDVVEPSTLTPFIIVGHSSQAACNEWLNLVGHKKNYAPLTCASMKQMSEFLAMLDQASSNQNRYAKVPSIKMAPSGAIREPWLVALSKAGEETGAGEVLMAFNAADIEDWAGKKGMSIVSVLPKSGIVATLTEMKKTQIGEVDKGYYADGPHDVEDMLKYVETWPTEKWKKYDDLLSL